jgi:hypothetical protein
MDAGVSAAIGGTSISAGLIDSQAQINQALGAAGGLGSDSIAQFASAYRSSHGGPILTLIGFNPFQIIATGAFHTLYWGCIVIFLGIMAIISMQHVLNGRYSVRGRHPLNGLVQIYFRLLIGVLLIGNLPVVYGTLMTVNRVFSEAVKAIGGESLTSVLRGGGVGTLSLAQARSDAIRQAAARRAIALYPSNGSRVEMIQIGTWYNAMASAINGRLTAASLPGSLPALDSTHWGDATIPADQVTAGIGREVLRNFGLLVADLGTLPSSGGRLPIDFPGAGSGELELLSSSLAADDAAAAQALALPATPASSSAFEAALSLYRKNVLTHTLHYLDEDVLAVLKLSPSLADRAKAWFAESVDRAGAAVSGTLLAAGRAAIDWAGRSIGVMLTRMVAFLFTLGTSALIEVELFVVVLAMPLWLLPATEEAFHGALRILAALSLAAPAYQFLMLFVDALMGLVLKYLVLGPLAAGNVTAGSAAGSAAYAAVAAAAVAASGGEIIALALFCYLSAYLFLAIYFAFKTPKLVAGFLKGAGAGSQFLSTFATGLVSGAAAAFATASVAAGAGGLTARWLQGGAAAGRGGGGGMAPGPLVGRRFETAATRTTPLAGGTSNPGPAATPIPAIAAGQSQGAAPPASAISAAASFGVRTFVDCLGAKSPADGFSTALAALADYRKQQEKEAEAQFKAEQTAAKAAAKAEPKSPAKKRGN